MYKKLWIENIANLPSVVYDTVPPNENFTDYDNDIEKWNEYGLLVRDFNFIRNKIQELVVSIVQPDYSLWNNLTLEQKKIACYYIVAPYVLRVPTIVTDEEDRNNWRRVVELTQGEMINRMKGRARIYQEMRIYVAEYIRTDIISISDSQDFFKSVYAYADWYVNANAPDFKWWLNNTVGTPYENDGFFEKSYFNQQILDGLNRIYAGDY